MSKDTEAIEKLRTDYIAANNSSDVNRFMATITQDAVFMPPDRPALAGSKSIRTWITDQFNDWPGGKLDWLFDEVQVNGSWAFLHGAFTLDLVSREGAGKVHIQGKHLNVFQKQADGSWKIHRACFNSDEPANQSTWGSATK